jgi:hypothetical protein
VSNDFNLTALHDHIRDRIVEIRTVGRGRHQRRSINAVLGKARQTLEAQGWADADIRQFFCNCEAEAELILNADE